MFETTSYHTKISKRSFLGRILKCNRFYFYSSLFARITRKMGMRQRQGCGMLEDVFSGCWDVLKLIEDCGGTICAEGMENITKSDGPVLFVGNHMSLVETYLLPALILPQRKITFVVKEQLQKKLWMSDVLAIMDCIGTTRNNPAQDFRNMLAKGQEAVDAGKSIVIFPQSTRDVVFHPEEFSSAAVKMARKFNIPIVPIALKTDFAPSGTSGILKDFGKIYPERPVRFTFGEPIEVLGNGKEEHEKIVKFISDHLASWK